MNDLAVGYLLIGGIALALFWCGQRLAHRHRRLAEVSAILTVLATFLYARSLRDSILLARLLPFSNLVVLGNWFPLAAGFLAGLAWRLTPGERVRRSVPVLGLGAVAVYAAIQPLLGEPPQCGDTWRNAVCLQTTDDSCSAACAATVLAAAGISASEQEMARLCLTRKGTTWQGLYRGLKLKTVGTGCDVEVFAGDIETLRRMSPGPMILAVGIENADNVAPIYTEQYGWSPGEWHSVVFFDFLPNDRAAMGDPGIAEGREEWTLEDLRVLWRGRGMRLVRTSGNESGSMP